MNILFWVPYPTQGPSNRYRVEQYLPYLDKEGWRYSLRPFWSARAFGVLYKKGRYFQKMVYFAAGTLRRITDILSIRKYDIVFIHREAYPFSGMIFCSILRMLRKPIVFDFDDAIFIPSSSRSNRFISMMRSSEEVGAVIRMCDAVIAGNSYLADFAGKFNPAVTVIPTSIDTSRYSPSLKKGCRDEVVIGWMGSVTTLDFLAMMERPLRRISEESPKTALKVVGGELKVSSLPCLISKQWSMDEEINDLLSFDIGIMPMPDNEWTRGKCAFKAIMYMSMGIACVCSPVGMNKELVQDGVNGFLASTEDEWVSKLSSLIKDAGLRKRMGLAGRRTVEERFSLLVNAPKFIGVLRDVNVRRYKIAGKR